MEGLLKSAWPVGISMGIVLLMDAGEGPAPVGSTISHQVVLDVQGSDLSLGL